MIFDLVLLEKVKQEPNIQLLLNTSVYEIAKHNSHLIKELTGFCSQNSIQYKVTAPLFCDASGDGILGFLSGASFRDEYAFVCFLKNELISLNCTQMRVTSLVTVFNSINKKVSNFGKQVPPANSGIDEFEFWCPRRRPHGHNFSLWIQDGLNGFNAEQVKNGVNRPTTKPNAWVATT